MSLMLLFMLMFLLLFMCMLMLMLLMLLFSSTAYVHMCVLDLDSLFYVDYCVLFPLPF